MAWNGASTVAAERAWPRPPAPALSSTTSSGWSTEQPRHRQRQLRSHAAALDRDHAAAQLGQAPHRPRHVAVVHAHADDVVRVVGDRASRSPRAAARTPERIRARPGRCPGAARQPRSWPGRGPRRPPPARPATVAGITSDFGHDLARHQADHADRSRRPSGVCRSLRRDRLDPHRAARPLRHGGRRDLRRRHGRPSAPASGRNSFEVGQHQQVGPLPGRDRAAVAQAVPGGGVHGGHRQRVAGIDAPLDRPPHHRVDVALAGDVRRLAVVGAERDPAGPELARPAAAARPGSGRPTPRGSAATCPPAAARGPPDGSSPRGPIRSRRRRRPAAGAPSTPGAWPSTCSAPSRPSFASSSGSPAITPGKFIISARPSTLSAAQQAFQVARGERPPRRLEPRGRHARRGHEEHVQRQVGAGVDQPVHAVGAEHVCDLVGVGDHGCGAERQHQLRELVHAAASTTRGAGGRRSGRARRIARRRRASRGRGTPRRRRSSRRTRPRRPPATRACAPRAPGRPARPGRRARRRVPPPAVG